MKKHLAIAIAIAASVTILSPAQLRAESCLRSALTNVIADFKRDLADLREELIQAIGQNRKEVAFWQETLKASRKEGRAHEIREIEAEIATLKKKETEITKKLADLKLQARLQVGASSDGSPSALQLPRFIAPPESMRRRGFPALMIKPDDRRHIARHFVAGHPALEKEKIVISHTSPIEEWDPHAVHLLSKGDHSNTLFPPDLTFDQVLESLTKTATQIVPAELAPDAEGWRAYEAFLYINKKKFGVRLVICEAPPCKALGKHGEIKTLYPFCGDAAIVVDPLLEANFELLKKRIKHGPTCP